MDAVRALALAGLLLACAVPAGAGLLRLAGLEEKRTTGRAERWLLSATAGLGLLATAYTLTGLGGLFSPPLVLLLPPALALALFLPGRELLAAPGQGAPRREPEGAFQLWAAGATGAGLVLLALAVLVQDLAPPTDYDGLLYHLVAPATFLQAGRIVYLPHNFSANLPALGELLFAFGLAGGSDRAPQLIHGLAGALTVGLTYTFGARLFGSRVALWGAAGLAATPLVPYLATRAYIDLFTVLFGLVAVCGVLLWQQTLPGGGLGAAPGGSGAWLRVAGGAAGLALATKYSALTLLLVLGAVVPLMAWSSLRGAPRAVRARAALRAVAVFGAIAFLVALPWYARQILELGSPVWPMYFGGRDWDGVRVEQLTYFVSQYGSGTGWRAWLALPWNVYLHSWRFGHVPDAYPPLLALAIPLVLLGTRGPAPVASQGRGGLEPPGRVGSEVGWGLEPAGRVGKLWGGGLEPPGRWLLVIVCGATLLWARGWQDLRFLLTIYPLLALLGAAGLDAALRRWPGGSAGKAGPGTAWPGGASVGGGPGTAWAVQGMAAVISVLVAALCLSTALRHVARATDVAGVVLGREPVPAYLGRRLTDFGAITALNAQMAPGRAALFLGDGQIWYCRQRCIPDPAHDNLLQWFVRPEDPAGPAGSGALRQLLAEGVYQFLLS
jgi:4-amino-4-deoxy-L-arabinose transferase-like glycosyltransferase